MEWFLTPLEQNPTEVVSLDSQKQELRITDTAQDSKIQNYINSAVCYFERVTGFILRAGELKIDFDYHQYKNFNKRSRGDYISNFDKNISPLGITSYQNKATYRLPIAVNVISQRPKRFDFFDSYGDFHSLTQEELDALPADFFLPIQKKPLDFELKDFKNLAQEKNFTPTSKQITISIMILAGEFEEDIKNCIRRIVSKMFENPDSSISTFSDDIISSALERYNMRAGL